MLSVFNLIWWFVLVLWSDAFVLIVLAIRKTHFSRDVGSELNENCFFHNLLIHVVLVYNCLIKYLKMNVRSNMKFNSFH